MEITAQVRDSLAADGLTDKAERVTEDDVRIAIKTLFQSFDINFVLQNKFALEREEAGVSVPNIVKPPASLGSVDVSTPFGDVHVEW